MPDDLDLSLFTVSVWFSFVMYGPRLSNKRTPGEWAYAHFHAQIGIYQTGHERRVQISCQA